MLFFWPKFGRLQNQLLKHSPNNQKRLISKMALARIQRQKVEPLSPRSANIQFKAKNSMAKDRKAMEEEEAKKAEAARKAAKEKEYAPEPPEWVIQPPLHHGDLAEKYRIGYLLGKGGFAVAYEGEFRSKKSAANSKVFALKVVRAKMSQKKMEDKVRMTLQCIEPSIIRHTVSD